VTTSKGGHGNVTVTGLGVVPEPIGALMVCTETTVCVASVNGKLKVKVHVPAEVVCDEQGWKSCCGSWRPGADVRNLTVGSAPATPAPVFEFVMVIVTVTVEYCLPPMVIGVPFTAVIVALARGGVVVVVGAVVVVDAVDDVVVGSVVDDVTDTTVVVVVVLSAVTWHEAGGGRVETQLA
jgi:hypothetical protein